MNRIVSHALGQTLALAVATTMLVGCADEAPLEPAGTPPQFAMAPVAEEAVAIATLRRATARYHNVDTAIEEGFILVHPCEERPGEGPVGLLYANLDRVADGIIDPRLPEGLIYEPTANGRLRLVGVELAVPYANPIQAPPQFLGVTFQPEDEFQVFGLHVWVWRHNPEGMFASSNPNVSC
jgi:hypothetical protein